MTRKRKFDKISGSHGKSSDMTVFDAHTETTTSFIFQGNTEVGPYSKKSSVALIGEADFSLSLALGKALVARKLLCTSYDTAAQVDYLAKVYA